MSIKAELSLVPDINLTEDYPLKGNNTFLVGGNAKYFINAKSLVALKSAVEIAKANGVKYKIIGNGSNLLISDKGYNGLIICTKPLNEIFFHKDNVKAMCGASLMSLGRFLFSARLTGMEGLTHIPASVGGAIAQNAGAFGESISDNLISVQTIRDGRLVTYDKADCRFSYRNSRFLRSRSKEIIVSATFNFRRGDCGEIAEKTKRIRALRNKKFPIGRTCGSVFTNPKGYYAAELIERAGLKGYRIGGAIISEKHANFITCRGGATATDVYNLIKYITQTVKDKFGVSLKREIEYIGEF